MATHNALGKAGEDAAAAHLIAQGYTILHRNWHKNHLELDIVATKNGELVVVEVKTRAANTCINPQDAVNWKKHFDIDMPVRFDIVTAIGSEGNFRIEHIENAFYPPMF